MGTESAARSASLGGHDERVDSVNGWLPDRPGDPANLSAARPPETCRRQADRVTKKTLTGTADSFVDAANGQGTES